MSKFDNLKGQRFGRLIATEYVGKSKWLCKCDCGKETITKQWLLKSGKTKSCGCLSVESRTKHGFAKDNNKERLYSVWSGMRERCNNPNCDKYRTYGARGISLCEEWNDYKQFREWALQNGYDPLAPKGDCTIDRIDVNGNYEPSNCRWVSSNQQQWNTRKSIQCQVDGEVVSLAEFARRKRISPYTLYSRLRYGYSLQEVMDYAERRYCEQTKEKA